MPQVKNKIQNMDKIVLAIILVVVATVLTVLIPAYSTAMETGKNVGKTLGTVTGNLIGSYEGIKEGLEAGKEAAANPAVDVNDIQERVHGLGKLEVLYIEVEYMDVFKSSEKDNNPDYAEIFTEKVKIVYTVDLTKAKVVLDDNSIIVTVPAVEYSDPSPIKDTYKQITTYQKSGNAGSWTDGLTQESRSHNKLLAEIKDKAGNVYLETARTAAINQIAALAKAMTGKPATVKFSGD